MNEFNLNPDYVLEIYSATAPALPYLLLHAVVRESSFENNDFLELFRSP